MFKIYACAVCQVGIKPEEAISLHCCPSLPRKVVSPWDGPFLCHSCQQKKEAMGGKSCSQGTETFCKDLPPHVFFHCLSSIVYKYKQTICYLFSLSFLRRFIMMMEFQKLIKKRTLKVLGELFFQAAWDNTKLKMELLFIHELLIGTLFPGFFYINSALNISP
jgi:hypothetical protein